MSYQERKKNSAFGAEINRWANMGGMFGVPFFIGLICVMLLWIILSSILSSEILPGPISVAQRAIQMTKEPYFSNTLQGHIAYSTMRVLAGFFCGILAGILLGMLKYYVQSLRGTIDYCLSLILPLPPFTLIALFIVWFGLDEAPKIALIFFGVFARMSVFVTTALEALPEDLKDAGHVLGASSWKFFVFVQLPTTLPDLFMGMRILMAIAWTSVMGAELIAANEGIGWTIWAATRNMQADVIFVGVFTIASLGLISDILILFVGQRLTGGWAKQLRGR